MRYLGGKQRIAKKIAEFINQNPSLDYYEPFCGANNMVPYLTLGQSYHLSDMCEDLILLHQFVQNGEELPTTISKEDYDVYKASETPSAIRGFVGFGCSFSGKWFGGYAKDGTGRNYALNARNSILKKWNLCANKNITFSVADYRAINPDNSIIYNDPPYVGTTGYDYNKQFNHEEFWDWVREVSKNNIVLTSEYTAPEDFEVVLEIETKTDMRNKEQKQEPRIERLFRYKG